MESFDEAVALRSSDLSGAMLDFLELQEEFVGMLLSTAAEFPPVIAEDRFDPCFKGLTAAIREAFRRRGTRAAIQRCQWHKRENVVSYLPKSDQKYWRRRLQEAYERPTYDEARTKLDQIKKELEEINLSAASSLEEGLEETLTLHRLGVFAVLGKSLKTTNGLESIFSMAEEMTGRVDNWQNSSQKHRWFAAVLLDIEPRLRRISGYRHLPRLREALRQELDIVSEKPEAVTEAGERRAA